MSDPADAEPPERARFSWPGADQTTLAPLCGRIARHLARAGVRLIGLLPVGGDLDQPGGLSPLLDQVAGSLIEFGSGDVAFIDDWRGWGKGAGAPARLRELLP